MSDRPDTLTALLAGQWPDPDSADRAPLDPRVRAVVIADDIAGREVDLIRELGFGDRLAVVSDATTHGVLGRRVERALESGFSVSSVVIAGAAPHADEATLDALATRVGPDVDAIVAVGSGTVNDLCKAVAAASGRPYAVFGTAPSMNGYASANASITRDGLKRTVAARPPAGVFLDLAILAAAPRSMIRGGLGECLCRVTARADWLLAHLVRGEPYREAPFALVYDDERELLDRVDGLCAGDLEAIDRMARILVLSGMGMTLCGSSHPSSQGEHLISHYMDMKWHPGDAGPCHGEQIAVTTLYMAELQDHILARDRPPVLAPATLDRDEVFARFGAAVGATCWQALESKRIADVEAANARLAEVWDDLRQRVAEHSRSASVLRDALVRAGAATGPAGLGWPEPLYREACAHAHEIRDRYTFLDLAAASDRARDRARG